MQRRFSEPILDHLQAAYTKYPHARMVAAQALAGAGKFAEARSQVQLYLESRDVPDRAKAEQYLRYLETSQAIKLH